jgi:predicted HD superfamily hydrolase involved in NAD metabolism
MLFSEKIISDLETKIENKLSHHRYVHTLGVKRAAIKIAEYCYSGDISEIAVAALLHDISKEYSVAEQFQMMRESGKDFSDTDFMSEPVLHSFTAPVVISKDYSDFATANILSSTFNHTTGSPDMSIFDEIIFVADYVEDGRKYDSCIAVRDDLFDSFSSSFDREECIMHLHNATIAILENTIVHLIKNKQVLNERTVATRNAFLARVPAPLA